MYPMLEQYPHLTPHSFVLCERLHLAHLSFKSPMLGHIVGVWSIDLQIWHTFELLAQDEIAPTLDEAPLKKLMKDSLRAETCFYNTTSPIIPSSCSSLRGSNGISPNSPKTFSTSLATTQCWYNSLPYTSIWSPSVYGQEIYGIVLDLSFCLSWIVYQVFQNKVEPVVEIPTSPYPFTFLVYPNQHFQTTTCRVEWNVGMQSPTSNLIIVMLHQHVQLLSTYIQIETIFPCQV